MILEITGPTVRWGSIFKNNEETQDYEELRNQTDVEGFRVFTKDQVLRDRKGKSRESLNNSKAKSVGECKSRGGFKKTKENIEQKGGRKKSPG